MYTYLFLKKMQACTALLESVRLLDLAPFVQPVRLLHPVRLLKSKAFFSAKTSLPFCSRQTINSIALKPWTYTKWTSKVSCLASGLWKPTNHNSSYPRTTTHPIQSKVKMFQWIQPMTFHRVQDVLESHQSSKEKCVNTSTPKPSDGMDSNTKQK